MVSKFLIHKDKYEIISANSGDRNHPVFRYGIKLEEELEISKNSTRKIDGYEKKKTKVLRFKNFGMIRSLT